MLTDEVIPFKSPEQYLSTDFVSKRNMAAWIKQQPLVAAQDYCRNLLIKRKEKKNLVYSPSQVELRSLPMPSIITYQNLFGDYYKLCEGLGFKNKYRNTNQFKWVNINSAFNEIIIDSRESLPLHIEHPTQIQCLNYGDYALDKPELNQRIFIERKEIKDAINSFTKNLERFIKEIGRAEQDAANLIVIVELSLSDALSFNYIPYIKRFTKLTPEFLFRNIRDLIQNYNIQFLFVKNKQESAEMVKKILLSNGEIKNYDVQLLYDEKKL